MLNAEESEHEGIGIRRVSTILGINVAAGVAYCAIVTDGEVLECEPYKFEAAAASSTSEGLASLVDDVERLIGERHIGRIVIVATENNYSDTYAALTGRIGIETAFLIAGARQGVGAHRISRPQIRAKMGLPTRGALSTHCVQVLSDRGRFWGNKRDVAALGALADEQSR